MNCPICKKPIPDSPPEAGSHLPFCSERCKLVDLGRWLSGRYQIPVEPDDVDESTDATDAAFRPSDDSE